MTKEKKLILVGILLVCLSILFFISGFFLSRNLLYVKAPSLNKKRTPSFDIAAEVPSQLSPEFPTELNLNTEGLEGKLTQFISARKIKRAPSKNIDKYKHDLLPLALQEGKRKVSTVIRNELKK